MVVMETWAVRATGATALPAVLQALNEAAGYQAGAGATEAEDLAGLGWMEGW